MTARAPGRTSRSSRTHSSHASVRVAPGDVRSVRPGADRPISTCSSTRNPAPSQRRVERAPRPRVARREGDGHPPARRERPVDGAETVGQPGRERVAIAAAVRVLADLRLVRGLERRVEPRAPQRGQLGVLDALAAVRRVGEGVRGRAVGDVRRERARVGADEPRRLGAGQQRRPSRAWPRRPAAAGSRSSGTGRARGCARAASRCSASTRRRRRRGRGRPSSATPARAPP